ncbi:MAG: IS110 family transposase [Mesorhizobium sp.]|uniref:transposase n=2 Tax=Mesorhizobium TaxID=68287 RepID=UPI000FEA3F00|nr:MULTISPECIES: transposase [unclassified Mesorhizobium]RWC00145.1 MAG: IS110 family transposase [Mesorhizobium sp.]RWG59011.1 MAG: IS110 family transposase [Mesorhizobium sp.]RWH47355.1 MAG: IS110 family transposase [Mesorhizobium sp.]RWH79763.1 MAG: IS110 family transposase [Mesorhizobium sp.]RWH82430.1 MAG: IS110 family transposase [Mesorhizobium sp.]
MAASVAAAIDDIRRFGDPQRLVAYLGLNPSVRQSGEGSAYHGRITKQGRGRARGMLVGGMAAARSPGPLRAFYKRIDSRRGKHIAAVATARKLAMIIWQMLSKDADYIWTRPDLLARKFRSVELRAGLPTTMAGAAPHSTTTFRPSAPKNDPESKRQKLPMQQRLPDGERGPNDRRLWKKPPNEKKGLFYNTVVIRPGEDGVRGELAAIAPTE